jgi:iron-sulfur cluster repair protein YtfE (RIC family)
MDAIEMLEDQHRDIDVLFDAIGDADAGEKAELFAHLVDKLAIHALIKERHFYPVIRDGGSKEIVVESVEQHLGMKRILGELLDLEPGDAIFDDKLANLREQVEQHVEREETDLFPKVRHLFGQDALEVLAQEMNATQAGLMQAGRPREVLRPVSDAATLS